jgi:Sigma-70 region 2
MKIQPVNRSDISVARRRSGNEGSPRGQREELAAEAEGGSVHVVEQLVDYYAGELFRVARSLTHDGANAEEIVQDASVRALGNLLRFRGDTGFYTRLVRITINGGSMKTRRHRLSEAPSTTSLKMSYRARLLNSLSRRKRRVDFEFREH